MVGVAPTGGEGVWVFKVIIPYPFCVQNNSNCTLATKAKMQRETTRSGEKRVAEKKRGRLTEGM